MLKQLSKSIFADESQSCGYLALQVADSNLRIDGLSYATFLENETSEEDKKYSRLTRLSMEQDDD